VTRRPRARGRSPGHAATGLLLALLAPAARGAASLPPHGPLRVLIVSDEVNPHGLPPAALTQPGELAAVLSQPGTGLTLDAAPDAVVEVPTNQIEQATALLGLEAGAGGYDVLIYFAHRIPNNGSDAAGRQAAFVAAVERFLQHGGGVVSFHHGAYLTAGKEGMQDLIGGTATGAVAWNTVQGQNAIDVAPGHFVTCRGVAYTGTTAYADPVRGVSAGTYALFNNTPDERYLTFDLNPSAGAIDVLFGSDYAQNGTAHLLGFVHRRPGWTGKVVAYQPGEYQPHALDPDGNNFQILANALLYATGEVPDDGIPLAVERGPGAGEVTLGWSGCAASYAVFRSEDAAAVAGAGNLVATTADGNRIDAPPPAAVQFYVVTAAGAP